MPPLRLLFVVATIATVLLVHTAECFLPPLARTHTVEYAWIGGPPGTTYNTALPGDYYGITDPTVQPLPPVPGTNFTYPPARLSPLSWMHIHAVTGNTTFYVYSGRAPDSTTAGFQDMWKFDIATQIWSWVAGSNTTTRAPTNPGTPGWRTQSATWVVDNYLYLAGGNTISGALEDIWRFNVDTLTWTRTSLLISAQGNCTTNNLGARTEPVMWYVDIAPTDPRAGGKYGVSDVYLYGGYFTGATQYADLWKWNNTELRFQCIQEYPTTGPLINSTLRDFNTPSPTTTYPGVWIIGGGFASKRATWVHNSTMLAMLLGTIEYGTIVMGYSIPLNRWAALYYSAYYNYSITPSAGAPGYKCSGDTQNLISPTPTTTANNAYAPYPFTMQYGWADYSIVPGDTIAFFAPGDTIADVWAYSFNNNEWTWFKGGQYHDAELLPTTNQVRYNAAFKGGSPPSSLYAFPGTRSFPAFASSYLPYALPPGNPPQVAIIGFGGIAPQTYAYADLWSMRSVSKQQQSDGAIMATAQTGATYTFLAGSRGGTDSLGEYGPMFLGSPTSRPAGRQGGALWLIERPLRQVANVTILPSPTLYMFGGYPGEIVSLINSDTYADMWSYDTNTNIWAWMGGAQGINDFPSTSSFPGATPSYGWLLNGTRMYITNSYQNPTIRTWEYNIYTDLWTEATSSFATTPSCAGNAFAPRMFPVIWTIPFGIEPSGSTKGGDMFFYGGTDGFGIDTSYMLWKWDSATGLYTCVQEYPSSVSTPIDIAGYRNFTTLLNATQNIPGDLVAPWVYNATLLIAQSPSTGQLWGYDIAMNRWSAMSRTASVTPVYPTANLPDFVHDATPGVLPTRNAVWIEYGASNASSPLYTPIALPNEPLLMAFGNTYTLSNGTSARVCGNVWGYSLIQDAWYYYGNNDGDYVSGTFYGPVATAGTSSPGSRSNGFAFSTSTPLRPIGNTYVGFGVPQIMYSTLSNQQIAYNDIFSVSTAPLPPPSEPPIQPPSSSGGPPGYVPPPYEVQPGSIPLIAAIMVGIIIGLPVVVGSAAGIVICCCQAPVPVNIATGRDRKPDPAIELDTYYDTFEPVGSRYNDRTALIAPRHTMRRYEKRS